MPIPLSQQNHAYKLSALRDWDVSTFEDLKNVCAVYYIENLNNGKCYVGSSIQCVMRVHEHFLKLHNGRHENAHLKNAHACGAQWAVCILEECTQETLIAREQFWIDELDCVNTGYNLNPVAGGSPMSNPESVVKMRKRLVEVFSPPEYREAHSKRLKAYFAKPGSKERHALAVKAGHTEATRKASSARRKKLFQENPEVLRNLQIGRDAFLADPERRKKHAESIRAANLRPEVSAIRSRVQLERLRKDPATLDALQVARSKFWADPIGSADALAKRNAALRSEAARRKNSESLKAHLSKNPDAQKNLQAARIAYWAKPENRAAAAERARIQLLKRWAAKKGVKA